MEEIMNSINYSLDVRKRIQKAGVNEFKKLTLALPKNKLDEALKPLPKVNGFRKGKDTEIRLQKFYLQSSSWDESDWNAILNVWYMYTEEQALIRNVLGFKNRLELETIIETVMSSKKTRHKMISDLVQSAHTESVTQELLERWLLFSPLPQDNAVNKLIAFTPKQSTVDIKSRLTAIEEALTAIKRHSVNPNQIQSTHKAVQKVGTDLNSLNVQLAGVIEQVNRTVEKVAEVKEKQGTQVVNLEDFAKVNKTKMSTISSKISSIQIELNNSLERIDKAFERIEGFESVIDDYSFLNANVEDLKNDIELIRSHLSKTPEAINYNTSESHSNVAITVHNKSVIGDSFIDLNNKQEITSHLEQNLKHLGIKLQHARLVAKEVITALASGQLATLQGSLAFSVAERCAACLSGGNYKIIKIPFGSIESLSLEAIVCKILEESKSTNNPISIILEGINRSAFEMYGSYVRQFILERIMQFNEELHSIFMFATINDGPSMLPIGPEILELGPLISIDSLRWTNKAPSSAVLGLVNKSTFADEFKLEKIEYELEDSIVPEWLQIIGGPLWRTMLLRANSFSMELNPNVDIPFESTLFGWVVPLALYTNKEQVSDFIEFIDQDDRLKMLMIKQAPEVFTSDAFEVH